MGIVMLISHILGAMLNGLIYRNYGKKTTKQNLQYEQMYIYHNENSNIKPTQNTHMQASKTQTASFDFASSVVSSINSILLIGGVVCFTFVLLEVVTTSFVYDWFVNLFCKLGINPNLTNSIFCGIGEITKGCLNLSQVPLALNHATMLATFIISFGGISTMFQAMAFLKGIVPTKMFILQKFTHALCSTFVCFLLTLFLL